MAKPKGVRFNGYLLPEMNERFFKCMKYAWDSGWLKSNKKYQFVSWAVERVMTSIEEEMSHNPRFSDLNDN